MQHILCATILCRLGSGFTYGINADAMVTAAGGDVAVAIPDAKYVTDSGYTSSSPEGVVHVVSSVMLPFSLSTWPINLSGGGLMRCSYGCGECCLWWSA